MMRVFLFFLTGLISLNVYANCGGQFDPATGTCRFIDSSGREILYNSAPPQSNQKQSNHAVENITINLPSKYGAIARGSAGSLGSSMNENSKSEAIKAALTRCNAVQGNGNCKVVATVRNGCQSLSEGKIGKYYKLFYGDGKYNSEQSALRKCRESGAKNCRIRMPEECSLPQIPR